ncbi:MAG: PAS domain-containing protein [Treponema sp.]|jgi:two-component system phosphate regulon sensor histidine kinase PhoR|nr:PAS domain-containing protein [Treponema sp.]
MTIFKKSLLTLGLAAMGFSAALLVLVLAFMNSLYYETNAAGLGKTAKTLMTALGENRVSEIIQSGKKGAEISLPVSAAGAYRLSLIAASGEVIWDSHVLNGLVNHIDRKEIKTALEGREESLWRKSVSTGEKQMYHSLPVFNNSKEVIGVFRLSYVIPGFWARVSAVILPVLISALFLIIAALWMIFSFSRSLSISLARLVGIVQTDSSLLSDPEAVDSAVLDFPSLERALRALTRELNLRFEQARAEGGRLEAILNGMSEAVFAMDSNLILHLINPRARELFNMGNGDIRGLSLLQATHSTEMEDAAKKAIAGGAPLEMELAFHAGQEQCFQIFAAPLSGASGAGAGAGAVLVLQEITRLVRLERIRKDFVANVSHELRTPIQLIKGFSETLLDLVSEPKGEESGKQIIHFIEIIQKNAGLMENITNDLLTLAGLENGGIKTCNLKETSLAPLLAEAVSLAEPSAKKKQIEIIASCPDDLKAALYGSFIIQALVNLLDNGIKYSHVKSKLWVSARAEDGELVLEARDKGIGIPVEHLERVFERFYRVDRARSREAGGTGLGLAIVRHIALLHKGSVEVESNGAFRSTAENSGAKPPAQSYAEGSLFRIRIPLVQN